MIHRHSTRVYYEDVDLAGIVYYANYLRFYERARSEALRALGVDQTALRAAGLVFAVSRFEADYLVPARFDDLLTVETETTRLGAASLHMEQRILRDGAALNRARLRVAFMDLEGRLRRMPPDLRKALAGA
ncbi:MAG: tol-pal system-associated acyl-CoA thioesterase [Paracoccaceae bacterium]